MPLLHLTLKDMSGDDLFLFQDRDALKFINGQTIMSLQVPNQQWFQNVLQLFELRDLRAGPTMIHLTMVCGVYLYRDDTQRRHHFIS